MRKGAESTSMMAFFTRVLVRSNSLLEALYLTSRIRVFFDRTLGSASPPSFLAPFLLGSFTPKCASYCMRKGAESTSMMAFFTRVLVRSNSLLEALYLTSRIRVFLVIASLPHEKLPVSIRRPLNLRFPPLVLTWRTRRGPILVLAAGLPNSNFLFLCGWGRRPPVFLRLCHES